MTGFNLPPGCNVRDLPGNEENGFDAFSDALTKQKWAKRLSDERMQNGNVKIVSSVPKWAVTVRPSTRSNTALFKKYEYSRVVRLR